MIGASHAGDYHFWRYNGMASIGLRQVAELGATRKLESELKDRVRVAKFSKTKHLNESPATGFSPVVCRSRIYYLKSYHWTDTVIIIDNNYSA